MEPLNTTLRRGSRGEDVRGLQEYLQSIGYPNVKVDGIYGPITEQAVRGFQTSNGLSPDGIFGPRSIGAISSIVEQQEAVKAPDDPSNMFNTETGRLNRNFQPQNEQEDDYFYNQAILSNDIFKGNSEEDIEQAALSGDFSGLYDTYGKPFSDLIQQEAVQDAQNALDPRFNVDKEYTTQNTEDALRQNQYNYNNTLEDQADQFEADKTQLDQNAANQGVLFSGARDQKERKLANIYKTNQDRLSQGYQDDTKNLTKNLQYQYGDNAVGSNRLSQYYGSGRNTFNPKVAREGAQRSSLSQTYQPKETGFAGSAVTAHGANVQSRASGLLRNKANKLFNTGYANQL